MRGPRRWRRLASFGGHGGSGWRRLTAPGQWRGLRGEGWRDGAPAGLAAAERLAGQGPGTTLAAVLLTLLLSSAASFIFLANRGGQQEAAAALARHLLGRVALLLAAPAQAQTPDTTAPTLSSATANNTTLRLTYNEALDTNSTPEATAFTVEVDGSDVSLSATNPVAVSGMAVTLTLPNGVGIGKTVKVSYTPGSNPIQDSAGNDAGALIDRSVTVSGICDRTPAVRTRILRKLIFSGITNCANVTSSHLSGITGGLSLFNTSLASFKENDFDGLTSLQTLRLDDNSLSSLHEDIFNGLSSLEDLFLSNNNLNSLGEDIFDGLTSLDNLYLDDNSLSSLGGDIFEGLSSLEWLYLNNNSLSSLHEDIFEGLTALQILSLSENSLSSLDEEIFDGVTALQWLFLNDNSLRSLPEGLLSSSRLPRLVVLQLLDNDLVCLPRDLAERSSIIQETAVRDLPDCYGVSLSVSPTEVSEGSGGESITVTAALKAGNRVKTEATTVTISVEEDTAIEDEDFEAVSDFAITIASGSSSSSGTFTLTARKDAVADDSETVKVTGSTGLSNSSVAGTGVDEAEVSIRNTPPVKLSASSLTVEEGESGSYTVVLDTQPSGTVTITASSGDTTVATVTPPSLTFTTSNWDTAQTVTVSGVEDNIASEDQTIAVSHGISGGGYGSVSVAHVTVTVNDDDTARVRVSQESLSVLEGESGSYTVVLNTQPTGTVTITAGSSDTTVATVMPSSLTFTTTNWNTVQTVRVSSVENDVASEDQTITVSHGISGGGYGSISVADVTITVNDDDTPGVSVWQESLSILEGEGGSYRVVLDTLPSGPVTVTASSGDRAVATVTPSSLTFTTTNWNTVQTVTVSSVKDDDVASGDERVSISHTVSGYGDVSSANAVTVTVSDDDTAGVSISPTSLSMTEGETGTYTVVLESEPTGTVTITPSSGDGGAATVSPSNLTFSSTTWNTAQTITVTALQDDDNEDETVAISHSVRGYGSISSGDMVSVTVRDDDEATGEAVIQAWLPRFGRSVAQQVVERVSRRLQQRPQPGLEVSVAGEQLTNRGPWEEEQGIMAKLLGFETVSEGQLVEGTEFAFSPSQPHEEADGEADGVGEGNGNGSGEGNGEGEADGDEESNGNGEGLAFWGAGELSSFNGRQDTISLSATVTTALVAADWQSQRWQAGAALAHSWGRGSYQESSSGAEGQISSNLTGLFPYGRYALNPKLNLWGVVGHGWGRLSLLPEEGDQQSTSIEMSMAAVGLEGLLLDGGGSGLTIRSRADALLLGVSSEQSQQLAGVEGEVSRLRLGLEAQRPFPISQSDAVLTPSLALAIRQDSGDAETGFGLDLAASLLWSDPLKGMEVELAGRSLLSHGDQSFQEQGLAASFSWDPNPSSPLGLSLSLSQSMGASASSGSDALLNPTSWPEMETSTSAAEDQQFGARMGYGLLAYRDALLITPELGVDLSSDATITTLGFSLAPYSQQGYSYPWQLSLERQQHSNGNSDNPTTSHSLQLRFSLLL